MSKNKKQKYQNKKKPLNTFIQFLSKILCRQISYKKQKAWHLKKITKKGPIIYLQENQNLLLHLFLKKCIQKYNLPKIKISTGINIKTTKSFLFLLKKNETNILFEYLSKSHNIELFWNNQHNKRINKKKIKSIIEINKKLNNNIFLIPHLLTPINNPLKYHSFFYNYINKNNKKSIFFQKIVKILFSQTIKHKEWKIGKKINIKNFIKVNSHLSNNTLTNKLIILINNIFLNMKKNIYGLSTKNYYKIFNLNQFLKQYKIKQNINLKTVKKIFSKITAKFNIFIINIFNKILSLIWKKIYQKILWKKKDIKKIKKALNQGLLILIPSHKSHIDYLLISQIIYQQGLMPPHIAAGDNLSFFPVGNILKRGGAFFIKRSFKNNILYKSILNFYIQQLIKKNFPQEFFIEGTRSRTGKIIHPKFGLLNMIVNHLLVLKKINTTFIPITISYEKTIETNSYNNELKGQQKKTENNFNILKSINIIKNNYGKVYVECAKPILFHKYIQSNNIIRNIFQPKKIIASLAFQIISDMNNINTITSHSLIALTFFGTNTRYISHHFLLKTTKELLLILKKRIKNNIRIPNIFKQNYKIEIITIIQYLIDKQIINYKQIDSYFFYQIIKPQALQLEYYKNNIIYHFSIDVILAVVFIVLKGNIFMTIQYQNIIKYSNILIKLFKYEFIYKNNNSIRNIINKIIKNIKSIKLIKMFYKKNIILINKKSFKKIQFFANQLNNTINTYLICIQKLSFTIKNSSSKKEIIKILLQKIKIEHTYHQKKYLKIINKTLIFNIMNYFYKIKILKHKNKKLILVSNYKNKIKSIKNILFQINLK